MRAREKKAEFKEKWKKREKKRLAVWYKQQEWQAGGIDERPFRGG